MVKLVAIVLTLLLLLEANEAEPHDHKPPKILTVKALKVKDG